MEEKPTINPFDEAPKEVDPVAEYATYGCCFAVLLSAGIIAGLIYFIYWIITKLI